MLAKSVNRWLGLATLPLLGIGAPAPVWAASPTPISACPYTITEAGSYAVTRSLTATETCISFAVPVSNVALDLRGHSITGNGTGYGIACVSPSFSNTTGCCGCDNNIIANGSVARFAGGVVMQGHSNAIVNVDSEQNSPSGGA